MCLCCDLKSFIKKDNKGRKGKIIGGQWGVSKEFATHAIIVGDGIKTSGEFGSN